MLARRPDQIGDLRPIDEGRPVFLVASDRRRSPQPNATGAILGAMVLVAAGASLWLTSAARPVRAPSDAPVQAGVKPILPATPRSAPVPLVIEQSRAIALPDSAAAVLPPQTEASVLPPPIAVPTLGPELSRQAHAPAPPWPIVEVRRPQRTPRDPDQTASVTGLPKPGRVRIDAGTVARATFHRSPAQMPHPVRIPEAPRTRAAPWALPRALAPSQ